MVEAYIANAGLDNLIPPEIKQDKFFELIYELAREADVESVLEIGSSSGQGSTEALVTGLRQNANQPILYCLELSKPRFAKLQERYSSDSFVRYYNASTVSLEQFSREKEVIQFYNTTETVLNDCPLERILNWRRQEMNYLAECGIDSNGITTIKQENNVESFDLVLIDGSEFTARAELDVVYGAKLILLDDVNVFKNFGNYQRLTADPNYALLGHNSSLRNGYAVFERTRAGILSIE